MFHLLQGKDSKIITYQMFEQEVACFRSFFWLIFHHFSRHINHLILPYSHSIRKLKTQKFLLECCKILLRGMKVWTFCTGCSELEPVLGVVTIYIGLQTFHGRTSKKFWACCGLLLQRCKSLPSAISFKTDKEHMMKATSHPRWAGNIHQPHSIS